MDNAGYVGLSRQVGLRKELNVIANNIANVSTNGFRRESAIFAEYVKALDGGDPSLSIATMTHRFIDLSAGEIAVTNNSLDVAIVGDAFFVVETPQGERLTRDGAFSLNDIGELVTATGNRVLSNGGGPINIPQDATKISIAGDGSIFVNGQTTGQIGLAKADPTTLVRDGDNLFVSEQGYEQSETARVQQFALEGSNVSAVEELARLIEVQRTYEAGQRFMQNENERIERTIRALGQQQ